MNTELSHIRSLIDPQATKILHDHGVTPEQYLSWLMSASRPQQMSPRLIVTVCLAGGLLFIGALKMSGVIPLDGKLIALGVGVSGCLAIIFGLTSWTMRNANNPIGQKMLMLGTLRNISPEYLSKLNERHWQQITKQQDNNVKPQQQDKKTNSHEEQLTSWQKRFGWMAIIFGLGYFIVSESYQFLSLPLFLLTFGGWMAIKSARITLLQTFQDRTTNLVVSGKPAKASGIVGIIFGILVFLLGLMASIAWFQGNPI